MRQSVIKIGIDNFLNKIQFDEEYYSIYNNIFNETEIISKERFIFLILQAAKHTKFNGYFDELYVDVIKRRHVYVKELIYNFKISFVGKPTMSNKFCKFLFCGKLTEREMIFNRKISLFDFDKIFNNYFELNNAIKKNEFIDICETIYNEIVSQELNEPVDIKVKKKVHFSNNKITYI